MAIYSIWESYFPQQATSDGQEVTERIWEDMTGRWDSRERADQVLAEYAGHPNAVGANRLADRPRRRFIAVKLPPG